MNNNITKLIILIIFSVINISYSQSTPSNNLYAITSNEIPKEGQNLYVIDKVNGDILVNITLTIPYSISGILNVNESTMTAIVISGVQNLLSIDLKTGDYEVLKTILYPNVINYISQIQQPIYVNNSNFYLPLVLYSNQKNVSLLNIDFQNDQYNEIVLPTGEYFNYLNGYPIGGFDYQNNLMYILYPGQNTPTSNITSNIVSFNVNNVKNTKQYYNEISNYDSMYTQLIFVGEGGDLYSVNGNPEAMEFDVCLVDLLVSTCTNIFSVPLQGASQDFRFLDWFLTGSKQQVAFASLVSNETMVQFTTYDISNDFQQTQFQVSNIWSNILNDYLLTYFYLP